LSDLEASIVVPCRHEEGNVGPLLARLTRALDGRRYEVLFVDDSDNSATVDAIATAADRLRGTNLEVVVYHRTGSQRWGGLAGAVIDGMRRGTADRVVVMDSDLQHPPELVPAILAKLANGPKDGADLVMASRYAKGGDPGGLAGPLRRLVSTGSTLMAKAAFPLRLRRVTDPMTGFFGLRRDAVDVHKLHSRGFKILLEILARYPRLRRAELPLIFDRRLSGESKGDARQGMEYLRQLPRLRLATYAASRPVRYFASARFRDFAIGGAVVAGVGSGLLEAMVRAGVDPVTAFSVQLAATLVLNFVYNHLVTWRDRIRAGLAGRVTWFLVTRGSTQFLSWLLFVGLTTVFGWHHQVVNAVCVTGAAVVNYYTTDTVVFASQRGRGHRFARWLVAGAAATALGLGLAAMNLSGSAVLVTSLVSVALFNTVIGALEVRWRLYGWRTPEAVEGMRWPAPSNPSSSTERFSLIIPALNEAKVIAGTLQRVLQSDYPHLEILVSLCEGDDETIAEVHRVMRDHDPHGRIRTVIRSYAKSNKPRQLNAALADCTGTVVGVIDAEDDVAPGLLAHVDALFRETRADVVQGGVQLMTLGQRPRDWFKVHNVLEYFFWFTSRVFYQVRCGFVPLGGNTVFVRRELVIRAGGWPDNLTEDCALGVLLCTRYGAKVVAAYEAELVTREEVPQTIHNKAVGSLFWQRVRWNQGFLSVLLEGGWTRLPTLKQRALAGYILVTPFLQAFSGLLLPLAVVTVFALKVPVGVAMLMYAPFLPILITLAMQVIALGEFSRSYGQRTKMRHYLFLLFGAPFYQWVLMGAALWAVVQHVQGNTTWHKTEHAGHHRDAAIALTPRLEVA
jgi:cellulose synthase/poly-beta-1,6-N-acetylglucosamine synthase-like glycosyltransferase/putative flippase GtrA